MADLDLAALAREREARRGARAASQNPPLPRSWASQAPSRAPAASTLLSAHRSIRLARALGLAIAMFAAVLLLLGVGWRVGAIVFLGAIGFARAGAAFLHGALPPMLIEAGAKPPTDAEVASAASAGLFCLDGVKDFGASWGAEYALALDSLAFVCTYGKKNCLTNDMYHGQLTLGKITGLVVGKLREGVIRC